MRLRTEPVTQERPGKSSVHDGEDDSDFWALLGASIGSCLMRP
jgi:hypothetical protein